jgi:hypothetical protein
MKSGYLAIPITFLAVLALCPTANAQCGWTVGCVTYLEYDEANNEVWGYSYTEDWSWEGIHVSLYTALSTPGGYYQDEDGDWGYARVDFDPGWDGDGWYHATADHYRFFENYMGSTQDWLSAVQPLPTGETTSAAGCCDSDGLALFNMTLTGTSTWAGTWVREVDPGGGGPDYCYVTAMARGLNPPFGAFTSISGGTWAVGSGNAYGTDDIGYYEIQIDYFQNHGVSPCGTSFGQQMQIFTSQGWQNYVLNTLQAYIYYSSASATRAGVYQGVPY